MADADLNYGQIWQNTLSALDADGIPAQQRAFLSLARLVGLLDGTALVKVPDASHGGIAARPSQSAAKASAIIAGFDKYRTNKAAPAVASAANGE